jgi:hypothetical protein
MSSWFRKNFIEGQYADVTTAKVAAEWEKKHEEEEEKRRRQEEERRRQTDDSKHVEESRQTQQLADDRRQRDERQPQTLEEETKLIRQRLEEQRRRQEEERRRQEEERRRREEEERRRREEEEKKRREEEEQRRREEDEKKKRIEQPQQTSSQQSPQQQPLTLEEETTLIRERLAKQRGRAQQQKPGQQQIHVAPGATEGGSDKDKQGKDKQVDFDEVAKLLQETGDPRKVVEKLREMGYEVKEVADSGMYGTTHYGWVVKVGDRYIAISSGARVGRGDVGDYVMMELPDEGLAKNFLVGRYWGSGWGDPDFVRRAAEAKYYEKQLDNWMRDLGKYGYSVERVDWGPNAATPGFTYIIRDKDGNKVGEVQVARIGFNYSLVDTGLPPGVLASNDPRRAAAYFVYRHETGDENIAWRLAVGDERAKELYMEKTRYESEMDARQRWFKELTQRGLKPIAYSTVDGKPVVSENDLFFDEKTGVTYRTVLERQGDKITLRLVPFSDRDERMLMVKSLEKQGFTVVDDSTVERDGIKYRVEFVSQDGREVVKLTPYPEDAKKAAEREAWWELWREGFVKRGEYAVKDGVKYKVDIEEQDGRYVAKLTPVGQASPDEEPRRYRRGDQRGSLETMKQVQFNIEKLGLEKEFNPEDLKYGVKGRPSEVLYFPVVDEAFYGAFGVPLSQALHPAGRELYWRYTTSTLPGPQVGGFTLPERQELERVAETQRQYAERFSDVWTPLTFRLPTQNDLSWRTAVATGAEALTFWIPTVKSVATLAAARGLRIPVLTTERTATSARGIRFPEVPGDFFEVHYVEPRRVPSPFRGAFVGYGVGEGAAVRGMPGNWGAVFARAGQPAPGWVFDWTTVTYRDVADWLNKLPSVGLPVETRPRVLRINEVRGFARDMPPRFEPPKVEPPSETRGVEVKLTDAAEPRETPRVETPTQEQPTEAKTAETTRVSTRESPGSAELVEEGGSKQLQRVAQAEEDLVRPIETQLPMAPPVRSQVAVDTLKEEGQGVESQHATGQAPVVFEVPVAGRQVDEYVRETELPVAPLRELELVPVIWNRGFAAPLLYPIETRESESPSVATATYENGRVTETPEYSTWTAETPTYGVQTAETQTTTADTFPTPPPPPYPYVRGGYIGSGESTYVLRRPARLTRRGWRVYELLRI